MDIALHLSLFLCSAGLIWALSGLLVGATDRVARRYNRPGFAVAFFVLGILTSISELSVMFNATIEGVPQVSAGNLVGGSLVIFLLIIPLLAVLGDGVAMNSVLVGRNLVFLLAVVSLPAFFVLDGDMTRNEGLLMILAYFTLLYFVKNGKAPEVVARKTMRAVKKELIHKRHATLVDVAKITLAAILIFFAGKLLVDESIYFSTLLSIPASLVGLLLLSIGTNAPELVIAIRCVVGRHKDIAFGDYMGSAAANTLIMGLLALLNGAFALERTEFLSTFLLLTIGLVLFFFFSRSKFDISRSEGLIMLCIYGTFLVVQIFNVTQFAGS